VPLARPFFVSALFRPLTRGRQSLVEGPVWRIFATLSVAGGGIMRLQQFFLS